MHSSSNVEEEELAKVLLHTGSLKFGLFTLSGGKLSQYYLDMRVIPSFPGAFQSATKLLTTNARKIDGVDKVGGIPTGGLVWASVLAYNLTKPLVYARKEIKHHGREKMVEGVLIPGERVLVIDDVVTSGKSISNAASSLRAEGGVVEDVLVREIPDAAVSGCWTLYRVGSRNERLGITGTSHMVEHMLFKGGGKLGKGDIGKLVSRLGGEYNGFTTKDFTAYYEILPADQIETGLMIEAERMENAAFDPKEVDSERTVMLSEREGNENDPEFQTLEELFLSAYRIHPYRWSEGGLKQDIMRINREDLVDYYHRYYVPSNAVLVVVGPYSASQVIPKVEGYFGNLAAKKPPSDPVNVEPAQVGERRVELKVPSEADYLKVAYHTPSFENEDVYPLIMLDSVLGGIRLFAFGPGQTSGRSLRLYKALVERKIASYAS